jgi:hypothetical protein
VPYRHNINTHKRTDRAHKIRRAALLITAVLILVGGYITIDWILSSIRSSHSTVTTATTTSVRSASVSSYRTNYFQFQAPDDWVFVSSQSNEKKFVYFKKDGERVTQRFIVYVDRPLANREADMPLTNVLPVIKVTDNSLEAKQVSDHCIKVATLEKNGPNDRIVMDGASFICSRSSQQYNVVISEYEGDEQLNFNSDRNGEYSLSMIYSDLTAYPSPGDLYNIVSTFETL